MGKPLPRVAVVIPNWNGSDDLRACLASLDAQQGVDLEVMVVDNGSSDGSLELLCRLGITHVALPRNVGFARAVNLGAARTEARLLLPLNADTVLEAGAIAELAGAMSAEPDLGGVQPRILSISPGEERDPDDPDALVYSLGQALTADGRACEEQIGRRQGRTPPASREIFGVCGAVCMFRRQMFDELGGYDERYFAFYEDVDLNVRARIAGWSFRLVPSAVVWHVGNVSWQAGFARPAAENARLVARNRLCTQVKFMPLRSLPRIALVEAGSTIRAALDRRLISTLGGKLAVIGMLPALIRDRRRLRDQGDTELVRRWLGRSRR